MAEDDDFILEDGTAVEVISEGEDVLPTRRRNITYSNSSMAMATDDGHIQSCSEDASEGEPFYDETVGGAWEDGENGFGQPSGEWLRLWDELVFLMEQHGLVDDCLALQANETSELMTQLLGETGLKVDKPTRDWLLYQLEQRVANATATLGKRRRLRGTGRSIGLERIQEAQLGALDRQMEEATVPLTFREEPRRGARGKKELLLGPITLNEQLRLATDKYNNQLVQILSDARAPVVIKAMESTNPNALLKRLHGKTRASTMKTYLKRWLGLKSWLLRVHGIQWPTEPAHITDYLESLAEDFGPSVPQMVKQAIGWMEKVAGYEDSECMSSDPLVCAVFDNIIAECGAKARPKAQATRLPIAALASLELYIRRESVPLMRRVHGGSLLFRSWGTLRFDDLQNLPQKAVRRMGQMVIGELMKSKTSGAGKRVRELPVALDITTSFLGQEWILKFLDLVAEATFTTTGVDPSYFLSATTKDERAAKPRPKTYSEAAGDTYAVLSDLRVPQWDKDKNCWIEYNVLLFPEAVRLAFSEHSPRGVMPSLALGVEPNQVIIDKLGRWSPGGSADYMRSYRSAVCKLQRQIHEACFQGRLSTDMREDDIVDGVTQYLTTKKGWDRDKAGGVAEKAMISWQSFYNELCRHPKPPSLSSETLPNESLFKHVDEAAPAVNPAPGRQPRHEAEYMIVYTQGKRRACLHKAVGGCPWARKELNSYVLAKQVLPHMYNSRCRNCWPTIVADDSDTSEPSEGDVL